MLRFHTLRISSLRRALTSGRIMSTKAMNSPQDQSSTHLPDLPPISFLSVPIDHVLSPATEKWHLEAQRALSEGIRELRNDHTSGAKTLATKAVASLVRVAGIVDRGLAEERLPEAEGECKDKSQMWWDAVRRAGLALSTHGRPSMGAAITVAVLKALEQGKSVSQDAETAPLVSEGATATTVVHDNDSRNHMVQRMEEYLHHRTESGQAQIGQILRRFLRDKFLYTGRLAGGEVTILTLSMSSTVTNALETLLGLEKDADIENGQFRIRLRIMESRPICEGAELARVLAILAAHKGYDHLKIELASDASVAILARDVDIVLIGADRISEAGDVSNKTGSFPAVLCAKELSDNATVIVLSDIEKVAKPGNMTEHKEEDNDPAELWKAWSPQVQESTELEPWRESVRVKNVYFEWVPAKYIDHYICETGILSVADIKKQSEWVLNAERRLFGDLEDFYHG